jgi:PAS domain S-box-containing protein
MKKKAGHKPNEATPGGNRDQWYRVLLESLEDAVFVHGMTPDMRPGRFIEVNGAACRKLGYSREELLQMSVPDINAPGAHANMDETVKELKENGHVLFETVHKKKDGRLLPVEIHTHLFEMGSQPIVISTARDITERKKWQEQVQQSHEALEARVIERTEELRKSEERFRAIADYTYDWENWVAPDGKLLWVNPAVERVTGYSAEEHLNHPDRVAMIVLEEDRDYIKNIFENAIKERLSDNDIPFRIRRKDGSIRWVSISYQPLYSRDDKYLGIRSSIRDITGRVKVEQEREKLFNQLREAQKMEAIGTLAGGIAHDFNNILAAIIGYSEMAADELSPENDASRMILEVLKASNRAKDLVQQILAFSRQGTGERKPLQIHFIIKEVVKLLQATIPKSIGIELNIRGDNITIMADSTQIHQVIMNLCTNAYHAMKDQGGRLTIFLDKVAALPEIPDQNPNPAVTGPYLHLEIGDTGHGMSDTVMQRIFDPYFTTRAQGEGTGLGLSVVHGIVKSHGGFIMVDSEPGKGTTFKLYFPCIESEVAVPQRMAPEPMPRGEEHILLVDDEEQLVRMWRQMLEALGYQVTAAFNSPDALELFMDRPDRFDLILTDMSMPDLSGAQLAEKVLSARPDMPLILCTGFSERMNEPTAKNLGFKAFLMKPVVMNELAEAIRRALDEPDPVPKPGNNP